MICIDLKIGNKSDRWNLILESARACVLQPGEIHQSAGSTYFCGKILEEVEWQAYLGVVLDNKMRYSHHILKQSHLRQIRSWDLSSGTCRTVKVSERIRIQVSCGAETPVCL